MTELAPNIYPPDTKTMVITGAVMGAIGGFAEDGIKGAIKCAVAGAILNYAVYAAMKHSPMFYT